MARASVAADQQEIARLVQFPAKKIHVSETPPADNNNVLNHGSSKIKKPYPFACKGHGS
jgi:hypothetical protein